MTWRVELGDCIERMAGMPDCSIDAIVTDPPYGIGFMGHDWDQPGEFGPLRSNGVPAPFASDPATADGHQYQRGRARFGGPTGERHTGEDGSTAAGGAMHAGRYDLSPTANRRFQAWCEAWATEALRVLKPGGHLLAFGGTRTYHRLAAGIEDAGFEIRDTIAWLYGSGFPKSLDVSKAIDRAAAATREVVGSKLGRPGMAKDGGNQAFRQWRAAESREDGPDPAVDVTAPATPEAVQWDGWGTALKPGHEPIVVARKPLTGTVAATVLAHGTGALNIDASKIDAGPGAGARWPANVVLDQDAGAVLDEQAGERRSGANPTRRGSDKSRGVYSDFTGQEDCEPARGADVGGASRFFYCPKVSSSERNAGLDGLPATADGRTSTPTSTIHNGRSGSQRVDDHVYEPHPRANPHPTVKPIDLMRWLVRMVTPPDGTILDPFTGSGTTGCAAVLEGFDFIGLERDETYLALAQARIGWWAVQPEGADVDSVLAGENLRRRVADTGQTSLLDGAAA